MVGEQPKVALCKAAMVLAAALMLLRFIGLEHSPPGFYIDEAAGATNIMCFAENGTNEAGNPFYLFTRGLGGGYFTPVYLYFGRIWILLFGSSVGSFRAIAVFFSLLTLAGIYLTAKKLAGPRAAAWALLAGALSPWSIQFSRIAWDPPLMPCFTIWGVYFWIAAKSLRYYLLSSVAFSLALYSYPTARVQIPLLLIFLLGVRNDAKRPSLLPVAAFFVTLLVVSAPLIYLTVTGKIQGRFQMIGIFSQYYFAKVGSDSWWTILTAFVGNFLKHFSFKYLFLTGDSNLRHSTGRFGELSFLDAFAILLLAYAFVRGRLTAMDKPFKYLLGLAMTGYLSGVVPSAMTWESIPHALRSIGSWPFLSLFVGAMIAQFDRSEIPAFTLACIYSLLFWGYYFVSYPSKSFAWFDTSVKERAQLSASLNNWNSFLYTEYDQMALRYYLMHFGKLSCEESRSAAQRKTVK